MFSTDFYTGLFRSFFLCFVFLHLTNGLSFKSCPPTETAVVPSQSAKTSVVWVPPEIEGDGTNIAISHDHNPGDQFSIGNTTVTYSAFNLTGTSVVDSTVCTFVVRVLDITPPLILNCPYPISLGLPRGQLNTNIVWASPIAIDNSGIVNLTSTYHPGDIFFLGEAEVLYLARDPSGNEAECAFNISLHALNTSTTDITNGLGLITATSTTSTSKLPTSSQSTTDKNASQFKGLSPMWNGKIGAWPKKPLDAVLKEQNHDTHRHNHLYDSPTYKHVDQFVHRNARVIEIACITFISLVLVAIILVGAFYNKTITQALRLRHERRRTPFPSTSWEQCPQMEGMNDPLLKQEYSDLPGTRNSVRQDKPHLQPGEIV